MRYQPHDSRAADQNDTVAAVWPSFEEALLNRSALEPELEAAEVAGPAAMSPTPAAPDVPAAVGSFVIASYLGLLIIFFTLFTGSAEAFFAIAICALFMTVFFDVSRIFFAVEPDPTRRPSLSKFIHGGIHTLTGHTEGKDALIQMLIVPVLLGFGLMTMGIIAWVLG
jgi:hypothetical protein